MTNNISSGERKILELDPCFSTTRLLTREEPNIIQNNSDKISKLLFLPPSPKRKGEGGLRTKGYFKTSYDKSGGVWTNLPLPLITIVTVVFNAEKSLERTIQSVLTQSYDNVEYIIIDGGSTDGTLDIIRRYEEKIDYWVSEPDRGLYDAMNKGIQLSSGEVIGLLNSDDVYENDSLQKVRDLSIAEGEVDRMLVIAGAKRSVDYTRGVQITVGLDPDFLKTIDYNMPLHHPATFVERKVYETIGGFNTSYQISGDYDLIFRCYREPRVKFVHTDDVLTKMSKGGLSMKLKTLFLILKENFSIRKNNNVVLIDNFKHSLRWFVKNLMFRIGKLVLNDEAILWYYKIRYKNQRENI
ncbi:glycosyltransferase family 2 protein [Pannus brasiliensis CCIBt3594]|uniref:Glycosyltransferase family 2 protein n=1 Tax=Pannus brasiliensis CCIBt3594 TaxID=1427578 RepID=A0AAW9QW58_9CHRO